MLKKMLVLSVVGMSVSLWAMDTSFQELKDVVVHSNKQDTIVVLAPTAVRSACLPMTKDPLTADTHVAWETCAQSLYRTVVNTEVSSDGKPQVFLFSKGQLALMEPFFDGLSNHVADYWQHGGTCVMVLVAAPLEREKMRMAQLLKDMTQGFDDTRMVWVHGNASRPELASLQTILTEACKENSTVKMMTYDFREREDAGERFEQCLEQGLQKLFKELGWLHDIQVAESQRNHVFVQAECSRAGVAFLLAAVFIAGGIVVIILTPSTEAFAVGKYVFGSIFFAGGAAMLGLSADSLREAYGHY